MGKLKDFKQKNCKNIFCKILQFLLFHHLTQLGVLILILLGSGIVVGTENSALPYYNFAFYTFWVSSGILLLIAIIGLIFGLIINPIRDKKKKKNDL